MFICRREQEDKLALGEYEVFIYEKVFIYGCISGGSCIAVILFTNNRASYFVEIMEETMPKHHWDSDNTMQVINPPRL